MTKNHLFVDLLEKDVSVSIHQRNLRTLAVELFKEFKGLSPLIFIFVGIYGIYFRLDLGPLALISIMFINIAIVI